MIPEEMKECIGMVDPPAVYEVEKGSIRRYAEAVGDNNPLYRDEAYASKSRYGGIIAPPGFFGWPVGDVPMGGATGNPSGTSDGGTTRRAGRPRSRTSGFMTSGTRVSRTGEGRVWTSTRS